HSDSQRLAADIEKQVDVRRHLAEANTSPGHPVEHRHQATHPSESIDLVEEVAPVPCRTDPHVVEALAYIPRSARHGQHPLAIPPSTEDSLIAAPRTGMSG